MENKKTKFERLTITIPKDLLKNFKEYCKDNAINMSAKITKLIKKEMKQDQNV